MNYRKYIISAIKIISLEKIFEGELSLFVKTGFQPMSCKRDIKLVGSRNQ